MRIAILGATSQIAKDLIVSLSMHHMHELVLYARRPAAVAQWLKSIDLLPAYKIANFDAFGLNETFEVVINFIGIGNPAQMSEMGASIFDVTMEYDDMALEYLRHRPSCKYIFLSSGAVYGSSFDKPIDQNTKAVFAINNFQSQDWYAVAKMHAECRHRSLSDLAIIDIRVFNYFSHTQDISATFLICDVLRSIRDRTVFRTSNTLLMRDYLHPSDFERMTYAVLSSPPCNVAIDCYTKAPVDKLTLLDAMEKNFGLTYELNEKYSSSKFANLKPHYYSLNNKAADFGYQPKLTSLESVLIESEKVMTMMSRKHSFRNS